MTDYPTRGQEAPVYWDEQLRNWILEQIGLLVGTQSAPGLDKALLLDYPIPVTDPDLYEVRYAPAGGIAAGLAAIYQATLIFNEIGFLRLQASPDNPTDIPIKVFGRGDTKTFSSDIMRFIADRADQSTVLFAVKADGRLDTTRYPWVNVAPGSALYEVPAAEFNTFGVRLETSDVVRCRGQFNVPGNAVTAGDVLGTVDPPFRPSKTRNLIGSAGGGAQSVRVEVATTGVVTARTTRATAAGYIAFDGLSYTL